MAARKPTGSKPSEDGAAEVAAYLAALDDPRKPVLEAMRAIVLAASPDLREGIKWNMPSFRLREYFSTFNLRSEGVMLILHQGAKPTAASKTGMAIDDPEGLLKWLGKDRAAVSFRSVADVKAQRTALTAVLKQWIANLP